MILTEDFADVILATSRRSGRAACGVQKSGLNGQNKTAVLVVNEVNRCLGQRGYTGFKPLNSANDAMSDKRNWKTSERNGVNNL